MTDPIIQHAIKLRSQLLDVAKELGRPPAMNMQLRAMDAKTCNDSAEMLKKLGTEIARLRLGIGHYEYGKISRHDLIQMPRSWND